MRIDISFDHRAGFDKLALSPRDQRPLIAPDFDPAAGRAIHIPLSERDQSAAIAAGFAGNAQPVAPVAGKCARRQWQVRRAVASRRREAGSEGRWIASGHYVSALRQVKGDKCATLTYMAPNPRGFGRNMLTTNPFDDDKLREECGIFGIWGAENASSFVALGLHALAASRPGSGRHRQLRRQQLSRPSRHGSCRRQFRPRRHHPQAVRQGRRSAMSAIRPPARPRCATSSRCSPISPRAASRSLTTAIYPTP